ncbi:MAG: helix-turn-helix domain-containing protein [Pseudonocardiaceae bacterium]
MRRCPSWALTTKCWRSASGCAGSRRRRGLGLTVTAGLAGISKPYLSMLERGERGFNRRGLLEDLADAVAAQ